MKALTFITIIISVMAMFFISCNVRKDFSTPISTLKYLQRSMYKGNWKNASLCFSDEVKKKYEKEIETEKFYRMNPGTIHGLFSPVFIIEKDALFTIDYIDSNQVIAKIKYPNSSDKDGRPQQISLTKTTSNEWKIDRTYGTVKPK